jgi:transposase-like protein
MAKKRKSYDSKMKARVALEALKGELTMAELSSKYGIHHSLILRWKKQLLEELPGIFSQGKKQEKKDASDREEELYQQIGKLTMELEWVKKKYDMFS